MPSLRVLPFPHRSRPVWPITASALAHLGVVGAVFLLTQIRFPPPGEAEILPALYLYAPDHLPSSIATERMVIPERLGSPLGGRSTTTPDAGGQAQYAPVSDTGRRRGMGMEGDLVQNVASFRIDSVFSLLEVDEAVSRVAGSAAPVYPADLLRDGVEGIVETEFVVDTTGLVDPATIKVKSSSHPKFTASVEQALDGMLFRPARRGNRKVRQLVQQRFVFRVASAPPTDQQL